MGRFLRLSILALALLALSPLVALNDVIQSDLDPQLDPDLFDQLELYQGLVEKLQQMISQSETLH